MIKFGDNWISNQFRLIKWLKQIGNDWIDVFERENGFDRLDLVANSYYLSSNGSIVMTKCSWVFKVCGLWLIISLLSVQTNSCRVCCFKVKLSSMLAFLKVIEYIWHICACRVCVTLFACWVCITLFACRVCVQIFACRVCIIICACRVCATFFACRVCV